MGLFNPQANDQQLLLPVNPVFMWGTIFVAFLANILPLGSLSWKPDLLLLLLLFWTAYEPQRVGMLTAFVLGLCMDVQQGALLGQHALAYVSTSFAMLLVHRRLVWFRLWAQAIQVLPFFLLAQLLHVLVGLIGGGNFFGWGFLLAPLLEAALWPVVGVLLLAPQRRPPERDLHRPL